MSADFIHEDPDGTRLVVDRMHGTARIAVGDPVTGWHGARLPQRKVPALCRAAYANAGLPVPDLPDLPVILGEAEVTELAAVIYEHCHLSAPPELSGPDDVSKDIARAVLLHQRKREAVQS